MSLAACVAGIFVGLSLEDEGNLNNMINEEQAQETVKRFLKRWSPDEYKLMLVEDVTLEVEFGWVFFYNSSRFLVDNDLSYQLAGNSPILVDKYSGKCFFTGTAYPIDHYINLYRNGPDLLEEIKSSEM